jgi:hypothetical protein
VNRAGNDLNHLRNRRNLADYDIEHDLAQATAMAYVQLAETIIELLLEEAGAEPTYRGPLTEAIRVFERDVLRQVTWHA